MRAALIKNNWKIPKYSRRSGSQNRKRELRNITMKDQWQCYREGGIACAYDINNEKWIAHPHITMKDQWQC